MQSHRHHRTLFRFVTKLVFFFFVWSTFFDPALVQAADIIPLLAVPYRTEKSAPDAPSIIGKLPSGLTANQAVTITFVTTTAGQANYTWMSDGSSTRDILFFTSTPTTSGMFQCWNLYDINAVQPESGPPITTTSTVSTATLWGVSTGTSANGSPQIIMRAPTAAGTYIDANDCILISLGLPSETYTAAQLAADLTLQREVLRNPASTTGTSTQMLFRMSTPSDFGQGALAITADDQTTVSATNTPSMTFEVGTMASGTTCDDATATSSFGTSALTFYDLRADYIQPTTSHLCTRVSSNAVEGILVMIKSAYGRMTSTRAGVTFPASTQTAASSTVKVTNATALNLGTGGSNGTESYGACVRAAGAGDVLSSSSVAITNGYNAGGDIANINANLCATTQNQALNSANNTMRLLGTSFDAVWSTTPISTDVQYSENGTAYRAYADIYLKAAVSVSTPATNSYTDTLTVIAFSTF